MLDTNPLVGVIMLPGFHQDAHNDVWWGKGFTEWSLVRNAPKLGDFHTQPKSPLGVEYDLSQLEVLNTKYDSLQDWNIDFVAIYHYWFEGERLLDVPERLVFDTPDRTIPTMLYWANHTWSRSWTNNVRDREVLIEQTYSEAGAVLHGEYLAKLVITGSYFVLQNKVVFSVYDASAIIIACPNYFRLLQSTVKRLSGFDMTFCLGIRSLLELNVVKTATLGLVDYRLLMVEPSFTFSGSRKISAPFWNRLPQSLRNVVYQIYRRFFDRSAVLLDFELFQSKAADNLSSLFEEHKSIIPTFCVGFDNTPRYKHRARILTGMNMTNWRSWITRFYKTAKTEKCEFVLLNALNEWGEGMFVEPCTEFGDEKSAIIRSLKVQ